MQNPEPERRKEDRRSFVRVQSRYVVSYRAVHDVLREMDVTFTRDLGMGGMQFTCDKDLATGTLLEVILQLPNFPGKLQLAGKVLDCKRDLYKKLLYTVRVEFVRIKKQDLPLFKSAMDFLWKQHAHTAKVAKQFKIDRRSPKKIYEND